MKRYFIIFYAGFDLESQSDIDGTISFISNDDKFLNRKKITNIIKNENCIEKCENIILLNILELKYRDYIQWNK